MQSKQVLAAADMYRGTHPGGRSLRRIHFDQIENVMNTRELEELSRSWVEDDLTAGLKNFINEVGRLPRYGELTSYLMTGRHPSS